MLQHSSYILLEKKLLGHITGTTIPSPPVRVVAPVVAAVVKFLGVNAVAGASTITQEMVNQYQFFFKDFDVSTVRANSVLLQTIESRDVMATRMLLTPSAKWEKLVSYPIESCTVGIN